jgi:hypothetical protein
MAKHRKGSYHFWPRDRRTPPIHDVHRDRQTPPYERCKRHEKKYEIEVSMRKRKTVGRVEPSYHLFSWAPDIALATS